MSIAEQMGEDHSLVNLLGRGRRASTIRRRVLDWKRVWRYLMLTFGEMWPSCQAHFLDNLSTLAAGGSGRNVLERGLHL